MPANKYVYGTKEIQIKNSVAKEFNVNKLFFRKQDGLLYMQEKYSKEKVLMPKQIQNLQKLKKLMHNYETNYDVFTRVEVDQRVTKSIAKLKEKRDDDKK